MVKSERPGAGRAKISLGLSLIFAVGVFVYLWLAGSPVNGALLAGLVVAAGYWEYRRKLQDEMAAERYEAEAEDQKRRGRQ